MADFALLLNPQTGEDFMRRRPAARYFPSFLVRQAARFCPPILEPGSICIDSSRGNAEGCLVICPFTNEQLTYFPQQVIRKKMQTAIAIAAAQGAKIIGLGPEMELMYSTEDRRYSGQEGHLNSGYLFHFYALLVSAQLAALHMGIVWRQANIVVVGEDSDIANLCTRWLARQNGYLSLIARNSYRVQELNRKILYESGVAIKLSADLSLSLRNADIVFLASAQPETEMNTDDFRRGTLVCDLTLGRKKAESIRKKRSDLIVNMGGLVEIPGHPTWPAEINADGHKIPACWAEPMLLALEKKYECFSQGREITMNQVEEIGRMADKHGFKVTAWEDGMAVQKRAPQSTTPVKP